MISWYTFILENVAILQISYDIFRILNQREVALSCSHFKTQGHLTWYYYIFMITFEWEN